MGVTSDKTIYEIFEAQKSGKRVDSIVIMRFSEDEHEDWYIPISLASGHGDSEETFEGTVSFAGYTMDGWVVCFGTRMQPGKPDSWEFSTM